MSFKRANCGGIIIDDETIVEEDGVLKVKGGGGGGGLPSYTNEDIGKTLTLTASGKPTTETVVTIEEQTVSVRAKRGQANIEIAGKPLWQVGEAVHLTLNGTLYECVVEESLEHTVGIKVMTDVGQVIIDFNHKVLIYAGDATFTVSATIDAQTPSAAPAWVTSGGGGGGGALVVHCDPDTGALDKTWQEIADAYGNSTVMLVSPVDPETTTIFYLFAVSRTPTGTRYRVQFFTIGEGDAVQRFIFEAQSADGYPVIYEA